MFELSSQGSNRNGSTLAEIVGLNEIESYGVDYEYISVWQDYYDNKQLSFITFDDGVILMSKAAYESYKTTIIDMVDELQGLNNKYYCKKFLLATEDIVTTKMQDANRALDERRNDDGLESNQALEEFNELLIAATHIKSNDIHIYAYQSKQKAYAVFSVDKVLRHEKTYRFVSYDRCFSMLSAMYDTLGKKAGQTDFDGRTDQETSFSHIISANGSKLEETFVTCRVAKTRPELDGDIHVVIRVLEQEDPLPIKSLNLPIEKENLLLKSVNLKQGAVLTSGPMGSGKTVTMTSALNNVSDSLSVHTIEDPIEVRFSKPNFVQNQLKEDPHKQLALVLRQNVSVLYLGEIRDALTAQLFMKHVMSGHLGCATTHANSAIGIVPRLLSLGLTATDLASPGTLSLLIAQRLEKISCPHCKVQIQHQDIVGNDNYELTTAWNEFALTDEDTIYTHGEGCEHCHLGTLGRQIIMEQIPIGKRDRTFIGCNDLNGWVAYLEEAEFDSLRKQTITFVKKGILCPVQSLNSLSSE
ncbi:MAG: type II secretory ATPase GspE/PulE/Tfp pilus assembly ATPase PilB-like protein [Oleiphilaceae bacterium]|jgi:type II secretory ATPase GspE/PulE/Tfp pilus assembly ATPase PilB-like protein